MCTLFQTDKQDEFNANDTTLNIPCECKIIRFKTDEKKNQQMDTKMALFFIFKMQML